MKKEWLVADVTAVGSLDRAERAISGGIVAGCVFGKSIKAQEEVPTSQSGSATTNMS